MRPNCTVVAALIVLTAFSGYAQQPATTQGVSGREALTAAVYLASEVDPSDLAARGKAIDFLWDQIRWSDTEHAIALEAARVLADTEQATDQIVASRGKLPADYLWAMRRSLARYRAAQLAGQKEWSARQLTAARKYAVKAADALDAQAAFDDSNGRKAASRPFGVRRTAAKAKAFADKIKAEGLSADHRRMLAASGKSEPQIQAYQRELLATPLDQWGLSLAEGFEHVAAARRALAASLREVAAGKASAHAPMANVYDVVNPHDKPQKIALTIRRVSLPADWKLLVVDAEPPPVLNGRPQPLVKEETPGQAYAVNLPAKGKVKVASVVVPTGELAQDTTARWAVEGRIGQELIGGMMHELTVPAYVADVQLPAEESPPQIASVQANAPAPAAAPTVTSNRSITPWIIAGVALLSIPILLLLLRRRRREAEGARTS